MGKRKTFAGALILVVGLLLLSAPGVPAQDMCVGDFDYDSDCDGTDAATFKADYGRGGYNKPCPLDGPAPVPKTGMTISLFTSDDGDLQKGVAWPNPRFTDNEDGTVTDNLTGLLWLKKMDCHIRNWEWALRACRDEVFDGQCGLNDGSSAGDWRLPNVLELESLRSVAWTLPSLSNTAGTGQWSEGDPFTGVEFSGCNDCNYWTSNVVMTFSLNLYYQMSFDGGNVNYANDHYNYVTCVRQ